MFRFLSSKKIGGEKFPWALTLAVTGAFLALHARDAFAQGGQGAGTGAMTTQEWNAAREQERAIEEIIRFTARMDGKDAGEKLRTMFRDGDIKIGPVIGNDNAETDSETKKITLNRKMAEQIVEGKGEKRNIKFQAIADWAATIQHEIVHARQTQKFITYSNIRHAAGGANPAEIEGWRGGFDPLLRWARKIEGEMRSATGTEKEKMAAELYDVCVNFINYESNFMQGKFLGWFDVMELTGEDGYSISLSNALGKIKDMKALAEAVLAGKFSVLTSPRVIRPAMGEVYELHAQVFGPPLGSKPARLDSINFTFYWYADGVLMKPRGDVFRRTAKKDEKITLVAMSKLTGSKADFTCAVTINTAAPAPTPSKAGGEAMVYEGTGNLIHVSDDETSICMEKVHIKATLIPRNQKSPSSEHKKSKLAVTFGKWTHRSAGGKCLDRSGTESFVVPGEAVMENGKCFFNGAECVFDEGRVHSKTFPAGGYDRNWPSVNHVGQYPIGGTVDQCQFKGRVECVQMKLSFDLARVK